MNGAHKLLPIAASFPVSTANFFLHAKKKKLTVETGYEAICPHIHSATDAQKHCMTAWSAIVRSRFRVKRATHTHSHTHTHAHYGYNQLKFST